MIRNQNNDNIKIVKCIFCNEETKFDLNKVPSNVSFDYKCKKCGAIRKNKSAKDDNMDLIIKLSVSKK